MEKKRIIEEIIRYKENGYKIDNEVLDKDDILYLQFELERLYHIFEEKQDKLFLLDSENCLIRMDKISNQVLPYSYI